MLMVPETLSPAGHFFDLSLQFPYLLLDDLSIHDIAFLSNFREGRRTERDYTNNKSVKKEYRENG
jgi:hypothetical protein